MELTAEQIETIRMDVYQKGVSMQGLAESLVDHICCSIEASGHTNFDKAYASAMDSFGAGGIKQVQEQTTYLLTFKKEKAMKRFMFILGYLSVCLCTTGFLFKLQHWPGASIMLVVGVLILNFGFLPMFFYDRYKRAIG